MYSFIVTLTSEVSVNGGISVTDMVSIIIGITGLLISLFVLFRSIWTDRFTIKVFQDYNGDQSAFIETYDGCFASDDEPDGRPKLTNIALARITISNNSSLPVSIVKFSLEGDYAVDFASHSYTEDFFLITHAENCYAHFGFPDKPLVYLNPIFKLEPYETKQGYISFKVYCLEDFKTKQEHKLAVHTSRGVKNFKIKFSSNYKSLKKYAHTHPKPFKYDNRPK